MPLINCEIDLILTWSDKCVLTSDTKATTFAITDTKLYFPVVSLSTQYNSSFKQTINWNKYDPKVSVQAPNPYLDFLINSRFQGLNKLFILMMNSITRNLNIVAILTKKQR